MGLFGNLFDKKVCAICGGEIGLLGNRKLEDGNLCKKCASGLSPWFSERRHSTVEEIAQQLAYREANYERVKAFVPTRMFGEYHILYMDDNMQTFTITTNYGLQRENPDIVDYAAYVSIKPEIVEHRWEDHQAPRQEGQPPIFKFTYDFYITVFVNHPYFDDMRFQLNTTSVDFRERYECERFVRMTEDCVEAMSGERPWLIDRIRVPMPQPIPIVPMGGRPQPVHPVPNQSVPHPQPTGPAPQSRPAPQPVQSSRPAPQAAPQNRPAPQSAQPSRPAAQQMPQNRPASQPGRPAPGANAPQAGRGMQQPAQQSRPQQPAQGNRPAGNGAAPSGLGRQTPSGNGPQGPGGRPGPQGRR